MSANSGPLNTVSKPCKTVYVIDTTNIAGKVSLIPLKPSIIAINKNGIKEVNDG